jgi:succinate dehydrogenase hydrophobic anchor subunit
MRTETKTWGFIALFCLTTALLSETAIRALSLSFFALFLFFALVHMGIDLYERWQDRQLEEAVRKALGDQQ